MTIELLDVWADGDANGTPVIPNGVEPPSTVKIASGHYPGEQPPCEWENWHKKTRDEKINEIILGLEDAGNILVESPSGEIQTGTRDTDDMLYMPETPQEQWAVGMAMTEHMANTSASTHPRASTRRQILAGDYRNNPAFPLDKPLTDIDLGDYDCSGITAIYVRYGEEDKAHGRLVLIAAGTQEGHLFSWRCAAISDTQHNVGTAEAEMSGPTTAQTLAIGTDGESVYVLFGEVGLEGGGDYAKLQKMVWNTSSHSFAPSTSWPVGGVTVSVNEEMGWFVYPAKIICDESNVAVLASFNVAASGTNRAANPAIQLFSPTTGSFLGSGGGCAPLTAPYEDAWMDMAYRNGLVWSATTGNSGTFCVAKTSALSTGKIFNQTAIPGTHYVVGIYPLGARAYNTTVYHRAAYVCYTITGTLSIFIMEADVVSNALNSLYCEGVYSGAWGDYGMIPPQS